MISNRFKAFGPKKICRTFNSYKHYQSEYAKHINYGSSGSYCENTNIGTIYSFLKRCQELEKAGYANLKFNNGGDDDWLVVDEINKEFGFFEDYAPSSDNMINSKTLQELWDNHD